MCTLCRVGVWLWFLVARERRHSRKQHHCFGMAQREASFILFYCNFDIWRRKTERCEKYLISGSIWVVRKGLTAQNRRKKFDMNAKRIIWAPEHTWEMRKLYNSNNLHQICAPHEIDWLNSVRRYWSMQSFRLYHVCVSLCVAWTPFLIDVQLICQNGGFRRNIGVFVGKIESSNTWTLSMDVL